MLTKTLKKIASVICDDLGYRAYELNIVIVDDETIRAYNRDWRHKDKSTDVLSFPQDADCSEGAGIGAVLGDVVISAETATRQALVYGHSLEAEYRRLIVHGVLHLLGYDHIHGGRQARKMRIEEERLTRALIQFMGPAAAN
ncbi:MAG: rRNA maturation RNase YbeY [Myxococcota bacterium]|nr:rRNA maturation RNase YbeY [Myxococcota bacterium]